MKKRINLLIAIVLIALVYFLLSSDLLKRDSTINLKHDSVSSDLNQANEATKLKIKPAKQASTAESVDQYKQERSAEKNESKKRSYLAIYRDTKLAKDCSDIYYKYDNSKGQDDILAAFNERFKRSDKPVTSLQEKTYQVFIDDCLELKAAVFERSKITEGFSKSTFSNLVLDALKKELQQSEAKTAAEISLENVFRLKHSFMTLARSLIKASEGESSLSREQLAAINLRKSQLFDEFQQAASAQDLDRLVEIKNQSQALDAQLAEKQPVDIEARKILLANFNSVATELINELKSTHPDTFIEAFTAVSFSDQVDFSLLEKDEYSPLGKFEKFVPEYVSQQQILFEASGVNNKKYYDILANHAGQLYMCYLGGDCGVDSKAIRDFCIGKNGKGYIIYPQACDTDLVTFYTESYLSPNQQKDVQALLNMIVENYAQ